MPSSRLPTASSRASSAIQTSRMFRSTSITIPHSSCSTSSQTKVLEGTFVRVLSWYDNEWGFSNRMADTAVAFGKVI